jgi:diadenosine tetraphosphate (Ap4A) HIT family hydrolase
MPCCDIFEVFDEQHLLVKEYEHWKLLVRKNHITLGSCVAITKRHHARFSELDKEEIAEFLIVVKDIETALKRLWQFDEINWLMLMMKDHHTHFHVIPRYKNERGFKGIAWKADTTDPDPLKLPKPIVPIETLVAVRDELRKRMITLK